MRVSVVSVPDVAIANANDVEAIRPIKQIANEPRGHRLSVNTNGCRWDLLIVQPPQWSWTHWKSSNKREERTHRRS